MKKRVLVTGGAGFIGSHLSQALCDNGYDVVILDNLSYGKKEWIPTQAHFIEGDMINLDVCRQAMTGVEGVFHCAAMSRAGPSLRNSDICTQNNIVGTQHILEAAREAQVKKIIYSGSSTYYGNQPVPHRELETPSQFLNFYALSKYVGEQYCLLFDEVFDLPCIVLRYFNVYGPRQPQQGAYALVMGIFLHQWFNNTALCIHGEGEQRRDFIHVNDVVAANIKAFESPVRHDIFNIGSGTTISIRELADKISPHQRYEARRSGDAEITLADITHAKNILKWAPTVTLDEGLADIMTHFKTE